MRISETIILVVITAMIVGGVYSYFEIEKNYGVEEINSISVDKIIKSEIKTELAYDEKTKKPIDKGEVVAYSFITDKEVKADKDEIVAERTSFSKKYYKGEVNGKKKFIYKIYDGEAFYKDEKADKWFYVENATTSINTFELATDFEGMFGATTSTYSSAGDGFVYRNSDSSWDTAHDETVGAGADYTADYALARSDKEGTSYPIYRAVVQFQTNIIPANEGVVSSTVYLFVHDPNDGDNDAYGYTNLVSANPASDTELVIADYDLIGSVDGATQGAVAIDNTNLVDEAYNAYLLNASGRSWISKTGYTSLGVREGHDLEDVAPDAATYNGVGFRTSERADVNQRPYIEIETSTCVYSGSGDWYINSSDNCYIDSNVYVYGNTYLLNRGEGSLHIINNSELATKSLGNTSTDININAGSQLSFYKNVWEETQPAGDVSLLWRSACSSNDGSIMFVGSNGGRVYRTSDGGSSWAETYPTGSPVNLNALQISCSDDGQEVLFSSATRIYYSSDSGTNWSEVRPNGDVNRLWIGSDISGDGGVLVAGSYSESSGQGRLWTSTDSGANWTERRPAGDVDRNWRDVAIDSDGSVIYVGSYSTKAGKGRAYKSTDSGVNWTEVQPAGDVDINWITFSTDDDGSVVSASAYNNRTYLSTDTGANWGEEQPAGNANKSWQESWMNSDGTIIYLTINGGRIWETTDTGSNWTEVQPIGGVDRAWYFYDGGGNTFIAGVYNASNGRLYLKK